MTGRECGGCTLCCKLLPMDKQSAAKARDAALHMVEHGLLSPHVPFTPEWDKPAGQRCPHQRTNKGCAIYRHRPFGCRFWTCRWLGQPENTRDLARPDRAHYVIDVMPDYVTSVNNETGERTAVEVVQIWLDPGYPDAHEDPALRAYLARLGEQGIAALVRLDARRAFILAAPCMSSTKDWFVGPTQVRGETPHSYADIVRTLAGRGTPAAP